jgi:Domain of unknown function (DUF5069)
MEIQAPDLTKRPPRSMRCTLGGYALLPRLLDKCRAEIAGTNGEYHYNCPLDQRLLEFLGIDAGDLKAEVAGGAGDGAVLDWIKRHQKNRHTSDEITVWTDEQFRRGPDADSADFFRDYLRNCGPNRTDITSWADLLDLDDYVSYGGKA